MQESNNKTFNHLKVHTQYSICEGAIKIEDLKNFCKENKVRSVGLSDTSNLCGSLEFSENSKDPQRFDVSDNPTDLILLSLQ